VAKPQRVNGLRSRKTLIYLLRTALVDMQDNDMQDNLMQDNLWAQRAISNRMVVILAFCHQENRSLTGVF
jgi:hypothetical protein